MPVPRLFVSLCLSFFAEQDAVDWKATHKGDELPGRGSAKLVNSGAEEGRNRRRRKRQIWRSEMKKKNKKEHKEQKEEDGKDQVKRG